MLSWFLIILIKDRADLFLDPIHIHIQCIVLCLTGLYRESTRVPPGDTQLVRLSVGELGDGEYRFEARGTAPIQFQV